MKIFLRLSVMAQSVVVFAVFSLASTPTSAMSADSDQEASEAAVPLRVGGSYKIEKIEKQTDGSFKIAFVSEVKTGRFDQLELHSDHVHFGVREGQTLRLSAEIRSEVNGKAEISQVVLFLQGSHGQTPVWLLSKSVPISDLGAARYLEMHAPATDFQIL